MKTYKTYETKSGYRKINFIEAYNKEEDKTIKGMIDLSAFDENKRAILNCDKSKNKGLFFAKVNGKLLKPEDFDVFHAYYINDEQLKEFRKNGRCDIEYQVIIK